MPKELIIDVSELEAPQPFNKVTQFISQIKKGEYLRVLHRKKPLPLIQLLQDNNFSCRVMQGSRCAWEIIIWDKKDSSVNDYCSALFNDSDS